jgi:hypothetical protein
MPQPISDLDTAFRWHYMNPGVSAWLLRPLIPECATEPED